MIIFGYSFLCRKQYYYFIFHSIEILERERLSKKKNYILKISKYFFILFIDFVILNFFK